tara:strand:+ start:6510 stop:8333 length:1824 start_codon:yes stop_codon:yes gene_type:complete
MWYCPDKYRKKFPNINEEFLQLSGELKDKDAKISLARFLRANVGFTTELVSGIKLAPFQEITLKGMLNRNFSMCVWGRGCGKTFIASVFCFLQCIFNPGTKILIAGPTFRTARFIFNNLERLVESKGAELLAQCFGAKAKRNDQFEWLINGGSITAIPLNGEKIRGFRANVLVLDEYLLLPEDIINTVLMPFLVAPQNMKERLEIREMEDKMIAEGLIKEEERMKFENDSKMVALSSASYTFENLYKTYKEWANHIMGSEEKDATYFISQMGYESLPSFMIDPTVIEEAQNGGTSNASFQREYCAQFTDGSDSYFSAKKMHECTIPDGELPTIKLTAEPEKKYVFGIDPSFSNSPSSDYFAIAVLELNSEDKDSTLVHNYAVAGGDLKDHINYMNYLTDSFKPEFIVIDNAGYQFIDACNENENFKKKQIKFFDFNSDAEDLDYEKMVKKARRFYNKQDGVICFKQNFTTNFIRNANEYLQACIDHKKLWFGSRISPNPEAFQRISSQSISLKPKEGETVLDLIEEQDNLIYQVKKQCALIEVKSTAKGVQTFDLPQHLKRNTSTNRARRDNYTALMLGNWGVKCYYDLMDLPESDYSETFTPVMIN